MSNILDLLDAATRDAFVLCPDGRDIPEWFRARQDATEAATREYTWRTYLLQFLDLESQCNMVAADRQWAGILLGNPTALRHHLPVIRSIHALDGLPALERKIQDLIDRSGDRPPRYECASTAVRETVVSPIEAICRSRCHSRRDGDRIVNQRLRAFFAGNDAYITESMNVVFIFAILCNATYVCTHYRSGADFWNTRLSLVTSHNVWKAVLRFVIYSSRFLSIPVRNRAGDVGRVQSEIIDAILPAVSNAKFCLGKRIAPSCDQTLFLILESRSAAMFCQALKVYCDDPRLHCLDESVWDSSAKPTRGVLSNDVTLGLVRALSSFCRGAGRSRHDLIGNLDEFRKVVSAIWAVSEPVFAVFQLIGATVFAYHRELFGSDGLHHVFGSEACSALFREIKAMFDEVPAPGEIAIARHVVSTFGPLIVENNTHPSCIQEWQLAGLPWDSNYYIEWYPNLHSKLRQHLRTETNATRTTQ